jgi:Kdo2-lipid IVA lauroyltransferase/acyltransferase
MARKPRRKAADLAVYLAVRLAVCAVQAVPMILAFKLADCLGWLAYRIDRRHRQVAADNLRFAFPDIARSPHRIDRLVRATYRHMTTMAVEIALLPRKLHVAAWRRFVTLRSGTRIIAPFFSKRPNLFVTAHFGNWEMAGWVIGLFGVKSFAIARVLDNPYLERYMKRFRQATGQTIIAKKDDFKRLTAALESGGTVGTLADQDAGPRGLFVDFFGRPASTHKAVALMAIEYDALISVVTVPRVAEPMIYSVECEDVIDPRSYAGRPDAVQAITQRFTTALERMIRRHPEQYFWLHRRWKHQPARRQQKPAQAA